MNISVGVGWYLIAMCAVEATLLACGFSALAGLRGGRIAMAAAALLAVALDLYTSQWVLGPYYAGLIAHRPGGAVEAFHAADLARIGIAGYLHRRDWIAPGLAATAWVAYLAGTIFLAAIASVHLRDQCLHFKFPRGHRIVK
jgi:hypothetical protein